MSEPKPFSLAVLKGSNRGAVLRTVRKRISVGSADDNDLVLTDANIAPRHFLVLIESGRWRIHTLSPQHKITVDRRWSHPSSNKRGALILAAGAELLLFPGALDDRTVEAEIKRRETGTFELPSESNDLVTSVHAQPVEFQNLDFQTDDPREMTIAATSAAMTHPTPIPQSRDPVAKSTDDLIELSQMATIAGERPPDDLRELARSRLDGERNPIAPSLLHEPSIENVPVKSVVRKPDDPFEERTIGVRWENGKPVPASIADSTTTRKKNKSWDAARKPSRRETSSNDHLPEVLAEPESQMRAMPGAQNSVMSARPNFATGAGPAKPAEVIELKPKSSGGSGNAWGDKPDRSGESQKRRNAWGDPAEKAMVAPDPKRNAWGDNLSSADRERQADPASRSEAPPRSRGNAWGDKPERSGPASSPAVPVPRSGPRHSIQKKQGANIVGGVRRTIREVAQKAGTDPATQILRNPDGAFATSVRLLAARMESFAKTLGYRAYMISSPEPLTGKTTAAINLAFALAEDTHRRVALLEADFRFPRFADVLGVNERQGVLGVVEGRATLPDSIVKIADRNLVIVPAGGRHPHPGEVLSSPRFKTLVAELVNTVDVAILDAPSVTPFADSNLILPLVDAAFLVVANGITTSTRLGRATAQLGENRVLGALYNHLPKKIGKALEKERKERYKDRS